MNTNEWTLHNGSVQIFESGMPGQLINGKPDITLNLGGAKCPILGLKSMKALRSLKPGQMIEIETTGSDARRALKRVSWMTRARMLAVYEEDGRFKHLLRKE